MLKATPKFIIVAFLLIAPFQIQANEVGKIQNEKVKLAYTLFETENMKDSYQKMIDNMFKTRIAQNPTLKPVESEIKAFFQKYMGWEAIKYDMAKIYAKYYTASELKELNNFYETPVGKKTAKLMPVLSQEAIKLSESKIQEHLDELQKIIRNAIKNKKIQ